MSCQSNGNSADAPPQSCNVGGGGAPSYHLGYAAATASPFVTGWMYVNENGQMCGPYIQQQLFEGLSTGFLPNDLPVYPVVNGALLNAVPFNYFKQFPDHVATGFAYLNAATAAPNPLTASNDTTSAAFKSSDESSWLYEDDEGRKHGPHSLYELYSWHQYGYLRDSVMNGALHQCLGKDLMVEEKQNVYVGIFTSAGYGNRYSCSLAH